MYKQIIIVRKDLNMSPGKMAAQVSHASMAFLTDMIRKNAIEWNFNPDVYSLELYDANKMPILYLDRDIQEIAESARQRGFKLAYYSLESSADNEGTCIKAIDDFDYVSNLIFNRELYEQWINGSFTKVILQAKNRNHLMKAIDMAESMGLYIQQDLFLIKDNCNTELTPEETDENGIGRTLTCIGFKPMDAEIIDQIGKKYHIYT